MRSFHLVLIHSGAYRYPMNSSRLAKSALITALVLSLVTLSFSGTAIAAAPKSSKVVATASAKPALARPTAMPSARPSITGMKGGEMEGDHRGFGDDEGSAEDVARHAAMQKWQDCLSAQGVTLPQGPGFGRDQGTNPGANPQASMSAKQQAAFDACKQYQPQFGPDDRFNGQRPTAAPTSKVSLKPMAPSAKPTMATDSAKTAAYIACLNKAGIAVKTMADINSLDRGSSKVAAALKSCAGKTPFNK